MARVLVGMSGGVDSSVAAASVAAAGDEVVGVSLQLYDHSEGGRAARCCSPEDFLDARRVADQLGFPYYVINTEELFGRRVLDYFTDEYRRGRTPNPCARCNAEVKFETLCRLARDLGATQVATGHYARLEPDARTGRRRLLRARDAQKDQSYFLFDLTPDQIEMARFPLGDLTKEQVRASAHALGLATAGKPESQDLCFVEGGDYRDFIRRHGGEQATAEAAGDIVDTEGATLGHHDGLSGYTVGQRRGLGIAASRRLYVVAIHAGENRVVLGDESALLCAGLTLEGMRYHTGPAGEEPSSPFRATVRFRYRHAGAEALLTPLGDGRAEARFIDPQKGVSPGQAAVVYDEDVVLGGGWIETTHPLRAGLAPADAAVCSS